MTREGDKEKEREGRKGESSGWGDEMNVATIPRNHAHKGADGHLEAAWRR